MRPINNLGDLWFYLRKKSRWAPGRAVIQLRGAEMVRAATQGPTTSGFGTAQAATAAPAAPAPAPATAKK